MDENMNNKGNENENVDSSFGSSEYYKKLYSDFPEDVAEMLIDTHPLMHKDKIGKGKEPQSGQRRFGS